MMTAIIPGGLSEALTFPVMFAVAAVVLIVARAVCNAAVAGYATVAHWLDGRRRRDVPRPSVDGAVWR